MWADTTAVARVSKLQVYDQLCFGIYMVVQVGVWLRFSQVSVLEELESTVLCSYGTILSRTLNFMLLHYYY